MIKYLPYILVMALVTYLIRMLPLTLFKKEINNSFIKSFLYYIPYAVLGSMTFPAIFYATGNVVASSGASIFAIYFAYQEKSLLYVAIVACISALCIDIVIHFI